MKNVDYLIVGGGISALSIVRGLKGSSYLLVEKDDSLGGLCRTHYHNDYVWDYAGHFFHFNNAELKQFFEARIRESDMVKCVKNTKIFYKGQYVDFPFQKNIHQLPKDEFIDCLYDLYFKSESNDYSDFEGMLYAKFGRSITNKFLKPYNEKLYACSLKTLDVNAMGRFFPYANFDDVMKNMRFQDSTSYNSTFDYPKKGAQYFINILKDAVNYNNVFLNCKVLEIEVANHCATISNGEKVFYKHLINTIPFNQFIKLCGIEDKDNLLSYNQVLVFNIGFNKALEVKETHWIYYPDPQFIFYRVGFYNNILSEEKGSIYVEIGFDDKKEITQSIINDCYTKTLSDLKKCNVVSDQEVVAYESLLINPGYVHITEKGDRWIKETMKELGENNVYSIGRYGAWTYCSMEDCMLQASLLMKKIGEK